MKKIIPASATWVWAITAFFVLSSAPHAFAKPQKKPAGSGQENPDPLVNAAMKNMETGVWTVNGTVTAKKPIKLQGLLSGEDFDLTMEPGVNPNTPMREIVIKNKAWICSDGETWHATRPDDRLIYNWAHVPIMADRKLPPFEKVGSEQRNGQTLLHVRLKVPEKNINPKELPQYWLVLDSQGQAQYIGHTEMPMFSQARKEVMYCSFDYAPAKEKIAPPPLGAPVDDKAYGFNDIEQHKFDWKGRVVRLEVTPKILESKQIGEDTYRGFFKDTATPSHYGVVEFPHDALVKLGFLKKIVSGAHASEDLEKMGALGRTDGKPVSFYVEVIPIGEKPAARAVAVGARLIRDPDGSVSYTWESDEKQIAKSPPAPATPGASDGDLVIRGIEKAKNGDLDGAIADFDRAAELDPKNDAPYYNRAQARRLKNDTAGAIADYTKAIELGSTNPAAYNNRGNARVENKDRDGAIADYTRAIELKPDYARAYYNRAVLKKEKGDKAGAAADFKRARQLDPQLVSEESSADSIDHGIAKGNEKESPASAGTVEDFFNRAGAKKAAGDLDGAIADYDRAIQLDPKDAAIYNNRGLAKQAKGDFNAAIADFNRGIELNPKDAVAYSNRGNTKRDKGDLDGAILDYNHSIRVNPKYAYAYYDRGLAKKQKSDLDGAIADYNRVIELDPKFAKAFCDRGVAKRRKGDLQGAISDYDRTIEIDPKYAIAYLNRGNVRDEKGDMEGAIADYSRGIELNPKESKAYDYRGEVHAKKKEYDAAVMDTLKAIELKPNNGGYYLNLGWYQLFNRKPREAIAASLKALELSPDDTVVIKTNLAHGYLFDNQFDKAKTIYLENKNAKLRDGKRTFSQAALDDFKEFQDAGITHPDMEKIKALLTAKADKR
jgi:tetratricopeptide (TPR) repeat protein